MSESIARQIHEKAAPVVAWLRTAEEESEEEEEEDEEVEVVYSESAGTKGITTVTEKPAQPAEEVVCVCVCVHARVITVKSLRQASLLKHLWVTMLCEIL